MNIGASGTVVGGIVVDEIRITATDINLDFDDFQGSTSVAPTTTVSAASLSADTGASSSDFITKTASQTISGTLSANLATGESVEVSYDNGSSWSNATTFSVGSSAWSTTTTLSGSNTFQARVTNADGSSTAYTHTYTLDTTAPTTTVSTMAFSADTGASSTDFITKTAAQTISGTLSANVASGETVYVSLDNGSTWAAATTSVGANTWSLSGQTLTASNTLKVKVTDTAGNDGTVASQAYVLDTTAPTTTVATKAFSADTGASSTDFITQTASQTISGTLSANVASGETVYVSLDNGSTWAAATTSVGANTWSLSGQTLTASNTLKIKVTDTAGNDGTVASQAYVLDTTAPTTTVSTMTFSADTGTSSTDFITQTAAQTISGTLSANVVSGETVYVSLDNGSTWTAATTSVGANTWSLSGQTLTASNTLKVKVTDTAGNDGTVASQAYTLDTTAPTTTVSTMAFSADTGASSTDFITQTAAQTISGTLSANVASGETVYVSLDNGSTWAAATTSVGANTWSLSGQTLTASNTLKIKVTDTAGNDGTVASQAYVLDTTAPTTVSSVSFSADTGVIDFDLITKTAAQTISGTLSANLASGETVYVSLDNGSTWTAATATVGQTTWSLSGQMLTASNTLKIKVTDIAGNDGTVASQAYVLDTTAPTTTVSTMAFSADTGTSSTDFITSTAAQTISGTLSANVVSGETVYVSLDNGSTWAAATTSVGVNTWSLSGQTLTGSDTLLVKVTDAAGNDGTVASQAYELLTGSPVVASVTLVDGTYIIGASIDLTVTFSDAMTVDTSGGTPRISLSIGADSRYADYVSGSGSTSLVFRYTVQSGDSDNDGIAVGTSIDANGGTLQDGAGNDANLTLNGVGSTSGVLVDGIAPTASSLVRAAASPTNASSVTYTLTFDEDVSGVGGEDFILSGTGTASSAGIMVGWSEANIYTVTIFNVSGVGTLRLDLKTSGTGITDLAGNDLSGGMTGEIYDVDRVSPQVTSVTVPDAGTYGRGETLVFAVTCDEAVIVSGAPRLTLTVGSATRYADYVTGSGSTVLEFRYAIQNDEQDTDGIALAASIDLNGGTLRDAASNNAVLTLNSIGSTSGVLVDGRAKEGGYPDDPWYKDAKSSCGLGSGSVLGMLAGLFLFARLRRNRR